MIHAMLAVATAAIVVLARAGEDATNHPPRVWIEGIPSTTLHEDQLLEFTVHAEDFDGDPITLRLVNPAPGMIYQPVEAEIGPVSRKIRWRVTVGGVRHLFFEATDGRPPGRRVRATATLRVFGHAGHDAVQIGDVTGDGRLDAVVAARLADANGIYNAGAIYVFSGSTTPSGIPDHVLADINAPNNLRLGERNLFGWPNLHLADVTGDGILDIVVSRRGVYVWHGGALDPAPPPSARLIGPSDRAWALADAAVIADVTGDGVDDLVMDALSPDGSDAVYVWHGGRHLRGHVSPRAILTIPGPSNGGLRAGIHLVEVTGDDCRDVLVAAFGYDANGIPSSGALFIWAGGRELEGRPAPRARLSDPHARPNDYLGAGATPSSNGVHFADVTADGVLDVLAGAPFADAGGVFDAGGFHVFNGGTGLDGDVYPQVSGFVPGAAPSDRIGQTYYGFGIQTGDVTGDGRLDLVIGASTADHGGKYNSGAIYLFADVGSRSGTVTPTAVLQEPTPKPNHALGTFELHDVTGDGVLDILAAVPESKAAGASKATGAVHVWVGATALAGSSNPTASLTDKNVYVGDMYLVSDLTGDGVKDVIGGFREAGKSSSLPLFAGGVLSGVTGPTATISVPGESRDLGTSSGAGMLSADVTGDGVLDLILGSIDASPGGVNRAGAVYVWKGGTTLAGLSAPFTSLFSSTAQPFDYLGRMLGPGIEVSDFNGDGVLDVIAGASSATISGVSDVGAFFAWDVAAGVGGPATEAWQFTVPGAQFADGLGSGFASGLHLVDLDGDGALDVLGTAGGADVGGVMNAGALYLWTGVGLSPVLTPMTVPGASIGDQLGS